MSTLQRRIGETSHFEATSKTKPGLKTTNSAFPNVAAGPIASGPCFRRGGCISSIKHAEGEPKQRQQRDGDSHRDTTLSTSLAYFESMKPSSAVTNQTPKSLDS